MWQHWFIKIESDDKTKYDTFFQSQNQKQLSMKVTVMIYLKQSILQLYETHKISLVKGSSWIVDSVLDHIINISKYNPLAGSSYIELPEELEHPRKGLINIWNIDDNECFE